MYRACLVRLFSEKGFFLLSAILLCSGLFVNLDVQPLYLEEPRRALIAMEMLEDENWIVPTQLGENYYRKPPGFNWVLMASSRLFGGFSEFVLRLPTVLSTLGVSCVLFLLTRKYVGERAGWLAALFFLCSAGILFYFSTLAEIDLFYALITFLGIVSIFVFYQRNQLFLLFFATYFFGSIGFLTKGLPSVLFTGISLVVFFGYRKSLGKLLSVSHILGVVLFASIVGGYLWAYAQEASVQELLVVLWGQSSQRTVIDQSLLPLFSHFFQFPLQTVADVMPGGLLLIFAIRKDFWRVIRQNEFVLFSFWMFVANVFIYWISPGARQRYIYMLYPFLLVVLVYCFQNSGQLRIWRHKTYYAVVRSLLGILAVGSLSIFFLPDLIFLEGRYTVGMIAFAVLTSVFSLSMYSKRFVTVSLILAMGVARLTFDMTVLPQRAHESDAQRDKDLARRIVDTVGDESLYIWQSGRFSFTTIVYINLLRGETLRRSYERQSNAFYIAGTPLVDVPYRSYLSFDYHGRRHELIRFLEE